MEKLLLLVCDLGEEPGIRKRKHDAAGLNVSGSHSAIPWPLISLFLALYNSSVCRNVQRLGTRPVSCCQNLYDTPNQCLDHLRNCARIRFIPLKYHPTNTYLRVNRLRKRAGRGRIPPRNSQSLNPNVPAVPHSEAVCREIR